MNRIAVGLSLFITACGPPTPVGSRGGSGGGGGGTVDAGNNAGSDAGAQPGQDAGPTPDAGGASGDSPHVDEACTDGQYSEVLPDPEVDISDLVASYSPNAWRDYVHGVLSRRYPFGDTLVRRALAEAPEQLGDCLERFVRGTGDPNTIDRQLGTFVHECGHFLDIGLGFGGGGDVYVINPQLTLTCQNGDSTDRRGRTFARSRIVNDDFGPERPPCNGGRNNCDTYADIYLNGDPDDGNFDSGDQGFNMLMEESFQYVNSLATSYAVHDTQRGSTSARDGILTHLWWVTRYLNMARNEYPEAHAFLLGDPCWREAVLTLWGRAWLYLAHTEGMGSLGIDDGVLLDLVEEPTLLAEIDAFREADGCN